jgi:hypothetical protein
VSTRFRWSHASFGLLQLRSVLSVLSLTRQCSLPLSTADIEYAIVNTFHLTIFKRNAFLSSRFQCLASSGENIRTPSASLLRSHSESYQKAVLTIFTEVIRNPTAFLRPDLHELPQASATFRTSVKQGGGSAVRSPAATSPALFGVLTKPNMLRERAVMER